MESRKQKLFLVWVAKEYGDSSVPLLGFTTPSQAWKLGNPSAFLTRGSSTASFPKQVEKQV